MIKKPKLNTPMKSDNPRYKKKVYIRNPENGKIKKIYFGDPRYRNNYSEKAWRKYRARAEAIRDKKGRLTKDNRLSKNYWAIRVLWHGRKGWRKLRKR